MSRISRHEFIKRSQGLSSSNLMFIVSIMKGLSLGASVVVIFNLVVDGFFSNTHTIDSVDLFTRILLLVISLLVIMITYDGAFFGTLFLYHIPRSHDTFLVFLQAGLEFLLFAVLLPSFFLIDTVAENNIVNAQILWCSVFSLYCILARLIITTALKNIQYNRYDIDLSLVIQYYKNAMKKEKKSSIFSAAIGVILLFICLYEEYWMIANGWLFLFIIIIKITLLSFLLFELINAFNDQHLQRKVIAKMLNANSKR